MSKRHLKIELSEDGFFYVFDLNSTNGTLLNNVRISSAKLQNGDILSIGLVDIKFIL
jgi:pSer/pThr/pTyr-binding forkhead associated (FHA) protein